MRKLIFANFKINFKPKLNINFIIKKELKITLKFSK